MRATRYAFFIILTLALQGVAAQSNDAAYAEKIKAYITDDRFLSDLVDHLPVSETVPSPLEHFGTAANSRHYCPV